MHYQLHVIGAQQTVVGNAKRAWRKFRYCFKYKKWLLKNTNQLICLFQKSQKSNLNVYSSSWRNYAIKVGIQLTVISGDQSTAHQSTFGLTSRHFSSISWALMFLLNLRKFFLPLHPSKRDGVLEPGKNTSLCRSVSVDQRLGFRDKHLPKVIIKFQSLIINNSTGWFL